MDKIIITKDNILQYTTQEDIFKYFLNVNELPKNNISSPFTEDKKPSFKVYTNGSFKCNSSGKQGDAFQFVADLNSLDCKTQFNEVLSLIAKQMNIPLQNTNSTNSTIKNALSTDNTSTAKPLQSKNNNFVEPIAKDKTPKKLIIEKRDFTKLDLEYWQKLGVEKALLQKYNCNSISSYCWTGGKPFYTKNEAVAFAWELQENYKLYIPSQPNINVAKNVLPPFAKGIFGLEQLGAEKKESIVICEGEKDVVVATSMGFNAVTFGSGALHVAKEKIEQLQSLCKNLLVCYDADNTGLTGMENLIKSYPFIIPLYLPKNELIKGFDITDYFQEHNAQDFQKIIDLAVKNKNVVEVSENTDLTIFHKAENYLSKNYDLRFDVIANEIEISIKDKNEWTELNENSLYIEMQKKHIAIQKNNLTAILMSDFVPKFNPLKDYFENLPNWDKKTDFISEFLKYVELEVGEDREQFVYHFKKWCVRAVKCSTIEGYFNKQAFVLSDDAKGQSIGKTTFIRYLVPKSLNKYYCENLPEDKDAIKRLGQNFIINLDELATLSRTDINKLKSMFSSDKIKTRLPYASKDIIISRVANFIGSTNMSTFLVDESGSVRWLCFVVKKIDFKYSLEFNIDNLWSQAYTLANDESFNETMTVEDVRQNEIRNDKFQILSPERELIPKFLKVPTDNENSIHLSSTEIVSYISSWQTGVKLNSNNIGKAMPKCGFIKQKHNNSYGYWVVKINP